MQKINVLNKKTKAKQRILLYYICIYLLLFIFPLCLPFTV